MKQRRVIVTMMMSLFFPLFLQAQSGSMQGYHAVLDKLYQDMLPLAAKMIGISQAIAGLGALWYIAARVYGQLARAEPVDVYALLRPFAIGLCIAFFPFVLSIINGVMSPIVTVTANMAGNSDGTLKSMLAAKEAAQKADPTWQMYIGEDGSGDRDRWYEYEHPEDADGEAWYEKPGNSMQFWIEKQQYSFRYSIRETIHEILMLIYQGAVLCINTIRTFFLVVMSILGPLVFGLSVFDAFKNSLTQWLSRYINFFLWLPVANIFGAILTKVQEGLFKADANFFSSTNSAYLIFMLIGILGYFTVPSLANYIVHAGGFNALLHKATAMGASAGSAAGGGVMSAGAAIGDKAEKVGQSIMQAARAPYSGTASERAGESVGKGLGYMYNKLKGN
jgi:conjugative transposon TraJ protein